MPDSPQPIKVGELRAAPTGPNGTFDIEWGESWTTWKWAVDESFRDTFTRTLEYVCALAAHVRISAHGVPDVDRLGLTVEEPGPISYEPIASRRTGNRLHRVLTEAVRTSGRRVNPHGGHIIDLGYWTSTIDALFSRLPPVSNEALAVTPPFLRVLSEWLRTDAVRYRRRRNLIRADVGLPTDTDEYRRAIVGLRAAIQDTAAQLGRGRGQGGLAALGDAARAVLALQERFPRGPSRVELGILFVEHPQVSQFVVPAIGLRIPPPAGYPLRLTDGTVALLPAPPWTMGWRWDPRGDDGDGG